MKVVLFGDSHAAQWVPALQQLATERGWQLISLTKSSCPAARVTVYSDVLRRTYLECDEWRERMLKRIEAAFRHRPAALDILYVNAEHGAILNRHPAFKLLWQGQIPMSPEDHAADLLHP